MGRPKKPKPPQPSDDDIRDQILKFLHAHYKKARSAAGAYATMGVIKSSMKSLNVMQHRIVSNLTYLVQNRWVEEREDRITIRPKGRPFTVPKIRYRISSAGIDRVEGPSAFQQVDRIAGINITNIHGVTVIGRDNVVQTKFEPLFRDLDTLAIQIRAASGLSDQQKLSYQAEIDTIKSQLMKEQPDRGILRRAWDALKGAATIAGAAALIDRVRLMIGPLT